MRDTKLEKVNKRLYHEPYKDGRFFKWEKKLRFISLTLSEIQIKLCLQITRPEVILQATAQEPGKEIAEVSGTYSQSLDWRICGEGFLEGDGIGLIRKDGSVSSSRDRFEYVKVTLNAILDSEKEKACGYICYDNAKYEKIDRPYMWTELVVPQTEFNAIVEELLSGRLESLHISLSAELFESGVDESFCEPDMPRMVYIEEEPSKAYISLLTASRSLAGSKSRQPSDNEDT